MLEEEELDWLLNDLMECYGYDFTQYARTSLRRRIARIRLLDGFGDLLELRRRIRSDAAYMQRFVEELTVNVTEMFRDPWFYKTLRNTVLPTLAAKPFIRIWHAGCSTGEEVFSMAILLKEEALLQKTLLYATDLNPDVLEKARSGIYNQAALKEYTQNYELAGGKANFSDYYTAHYGHVKFREELSQRMVFAVHNLVSDRSFNEFDLILCRNVLIYFNRELQSRVLALFDESLGTLGYLALGSKETIRFSQLQTGYQQVGTDKIWRKLR
ncbi:CheR family methyltransferase [Tellurirhabdus rosea]|uniref:CheR family methyltransferase n=1 Tax=Tellurirhabdus rosea TaxID=2674997 RepID=UPI00224F7E03|nr:protein-glutamate O-methyltransferase CheR [Tellurirhabdus rosea]